MINHLFNQKFSHARGNFMLKFSDKNSIERELKAKFETYQAEKNEMNDQI